MESWFSSCAFPPGPNLLQKIYLLSDKTIIHFWSMYYPKNLFSYFQISLQKVLKVSFCHLLSNSASSHAEPGLQPGKDALSGSQSLWELHSQPGNKATTQLCPKNTQRPNFLPMGSAIRLY